MTLRFFSSTFAVGTLLVVFFVQPFADVSAKTPKFSHFAANSVQRDDSNVSTDRGVQSDSAIEATEANLVGSNDSADRRDYPDDADSADASNASPWLRLDRNERGVPLRLATSILRIEGEFRADDGETRPVSVDLIGAIHLGEASYYERLNNEFQEYETVVFELVAEKGFDPKDLAAVQETQTAGAASPLDALSLAQQSLADALGFVHQIEKIDYSASNLKRGDADADDFLAQILSSGDVSHFFADSSFASVSAPSQGRFLGWALACAIAKDKRLTLRRLFANELGLTEITVDPDARETTVIHFRNEIAIDVAIKELEAGKTKIAVFYGAAHLDDLARRVEKTLIRPRRLEPRWITAWSMESPAK